MNYYQMKVDEVLKELSTSINGLSSKERHQRIKQYGSNELGTQKQKSEIVKFLSYFNDLIMYILMIAGILKGISGSYIEMIIIFLVVIINALIGYMQERKAKESLDSIQNFLQHKVVVMEDGKKKSINAKELVVGDCISIKAGDVLTADIRIIEAHNLTIEESILTGESLAIDKTADSCEGTLLIADQSNMGFSGTLVQSGSGVGIVVATGRDTEIGKINEELKSMSTQTTPLMKKMHKLNKQIINVIFATVIFLVFFSIFYHNMNISAVVAAVIALIISTVPEGLPAILSIILSLGVNRMAKQNAIIKQLSAVETLGSMNVICSDKTGTLTKNEMEVVSTHIKNEPVSNIKTMIETPSITQEKLLDIIVHCEESVIEKHKDGNRGIGNPTEIALLHFTKDYVFEEKKMLAKQPFDSKNKYMATLHEIGKNIQIYIKGAPDILLAFATKELAQGKEVEIDKEYWQNQALIYAKQGQRVLAFGYQTVLEVDEDEPFQSLQTGIVFVGLVGIIDPPKEEAAKAIKICHEAGVQVKMITGDHKETARAIAQEIGIEHTENVLEGKELDNIDDDTLKDVVMKTNIYARTTPVHKLRIVKALQANDQIVGMTGDGVNDAPALKKADIGVAMGQRGCQVSQEAADMILTDDNFSTIAKAIKEGRRVYDNLKKTIYFFLPTALAQGLLVIYSLLMNKPLPLSAVQILWLNMVSVITLSYALGFEEAESGIMKRAPRSSKEQLLNGYAVFRILYVSILIVVISFFTRNIVAYLGGNEIVQQTVLIQMIVVSQGVYLINCRDFKNFPINRSLLNNKALWISLIAMCFLQGILIYLPFMNKIIGTTPLTWVQLSITILASIFIFFIVEIEKFITKKIHQ